MIVKKGDILYTRSLKPVRIICTDAIGEKPIIGLIYTEGYSFTKNKYTFTNEDNEVVARFYQDGRFTGEGEHDKDLHRDLLDRERA